MVDIIGMFLEPIGGAKPKFSIDIKRIHLDRSSGVSVTLTCPAQAYPLPAFRLVSKVELYGYF